MPRKRVKAPSPMGLPHSRVQILRVEGIVTDESIQPRAGLDEERVKHYVEIMLARGMEPFNQRELIVVFKDSRPIGNREYSRTFWLADGFHRIEAAKRAGIERVLVRVASGTKRDAQWYAIGAAKHGLPFNSVDKEKAIKRALKMRPQSSDRDIADHIGVSPTTVGKYRSELVSGGQIGHLDSIRGRDGKSYSRTMPPELHGVDSPDPDLAEDPQAGSAVQGRRADGPVDRLGHGIEGRASFDLFCQGGIGDYDSLMCSAMMGVADIIEKADNNVEPFAGAVTQNFRRLFDKLKAEARAMEPAAECPYCRADGGACFPCSGRGWVSRCKFIAAPSDPKMLASKRRGPRPSAKRY